MNKNNKWLNDYQDFLNSNSLPPTNITEKVLRTVHKLINPSPWNVFSKIFGFHVVIGFLSLSVCHQFGLNPFNTNRSLNDWFMTIGDHNFCMVLCGVLFVSLSVLGAGVFLSTEEIAVFKKTELPQLLTLSFSSILVFFLFGAEITLGLAGLWILGALIGGFIATKAILKFKFADGI